MRLVAIIQITICYYVVIDFELILGVFGRHIARSLFGHDVDRPHCSIMFSTMVNRDCEATTGVSFQNE
jgi:hypothetical protein